MIRRRLVIASGNEGKVREFRSILAEVPLDVVSLRQFPNIIAVPETGTSFSENAILKATGYARQTRLLTLADDSGLEIEALENRPGAFSARYGGEQSSFEEKMAAILEELNAADDPHRRARFVCAITLADSDGGVLFTAEGICTGTIASEPRGTGGFGYDPIFIPEGFPMTFGELDGLIKQQISHRAQASAKIMRYLQGFCED
jgi:XTP/dITP diphosphohydrolase